MTSTDLALVNEQKFLEELFKTSTACPEVTVTSDAKRCHVESDCPKDINYEAATRKTTQNSWPDEDVPKDDKSYDAMT